MKHAAVADPSGRADTDDRVGQVEIAISSLLRVGVFASLAVVLVGTIVTFAHHPAYFRSHQELARLKHPGTAFPHSVPSVVRGVGNGQGRAIVMAGLLLLVATPVLRVAVSILAFVYQHDRTFVVITSIVLTLLLTSFVLGRAGG